MASSYRTLNLDVLTVKTILVKSAANSNIPINTILTSDGRGGTNWRNSDFILSSTVSNITNIRNELRHGLSTVYSPYGVSSLSSIVSYGLSSIMTATINPGVSSLSSIVSYGLSTVYSPDGISSLSSIVSYGLSTVYSPDGISSLSSIVSYGLSTVYSPDGISSLSSIVSYGLSTVYSPYGISSLSSIVSYGLSSLEYAISQLNNAYLLDTIEFGLSSLAFATSNSGVSSLSSIVSYGLSTIYSPYGVSSLSSIVSYGLSSFSFASVPFNTVMYNDGINIDFLNKSNNPSQNIINGLRVYSCAYGNNVWVASGIVSSTVPYGLVYSHNGINWNNVVFNGAFDVSVTNNDYVNNIKYVENNFVGIAKWDTQFHIVWSSNGINWNFTNDLYPREIFDYSYNASSNIWVFAMNINGADTTNTIQTTTCNIFNSNLTTANLINNLSGGFTVGGRAVSYNSNIWVAVGINTNGFSNVRFSDNGFNWNGASNITLANSSNILNTTTINGIQYGGTSIVYMNTTWYVAGAGGPTSNPIYRSSDGRNYTAIATADTSNINVFYDLLYDSNYSRFYSLANIRNIEGYSGNYLISSSNLCSNWSLVSPVTLLDQRQIGIASGIITPPLQTKSLFTNNIYSDTVNAAVLTGDGSGITNLNLSVLSNSLSGNIVSVSNSLSGNITNVSNSLTTNITTLSNSLTTNITTLSNSLRTNITNVSNFFTPYTIIMDKGEGYRVNQDTRSYNGNCNAGIILCNVFSLSNIGIYRFNIKCRTTIMSGNPINARPILYFSPSNYAMENTNNNSTYLEAKAMYQLNPYYNYHTINEIIIIRSVGFTSQNANVGPYHLWYSEQNSSASNYGLDLRFSDITIQRID